MTWALDQITAAFIAIHAPPRRVITLGARQLEVLVADTPTRWAVGLTGQVTAAGMLFVMPSGSRMGFHMRDVEVPLVIAFFDEAGSLVDAGFMSAYTGQYLPHAPYAYALELTDLSSINELLTDLRGGLNPDELR